MTRDEPAAPRIIERGADIAPALEGIGPPLLQRLYAGRGVRTPEELDYGLRGLPHVADLRNLGLVGAIELESRPGAPGARGWEAMKLAWEAGLMIRVTGDIIALSPPFIISEDEIERLFTQLADILKRID